MPKKYERDPKSGSVLLIGQMVVRPSVSRLLSDDHDDDCTHCTAVRVIATLISSHHRVRLGGLARAAVVLGLPRLVPAMCMQCICVHVSVCMEFMDPHVSRQS